MPLYIECQLYTKPVQSVADFLNEFQSLKVESDNLKTDPKVEVKGHGVLFVYQREYAVVLPDNSSIDVIGTDDATTCHIVVIRHTGSGVTCLAHCDGHKTEKGIKSMIGDIKKHIVGAPEGRLEVSLVGGFDDVRKHSDKLSKDLIRALQHMEDDLFLVRACITLDNDVVRNSINYPVIYGLGVEVKTGRVFHASFPDKGPIIDIRSACHFSGTSEIFNIYDSKTQELVIGPFMWEPLENVDDWIGLPDAVIRQHLSTSPEQEPEGFEEHVRGSLRVMQKFPHPEEHLFRDGRPLRFKQQSDGVWSPLQEISAVS